MDEQQSNIERYQHTSAVLKNQLIIFGGWKFINEGTREKECLSDIIMFNTDNNEIKKIKNINDSNIARRAATGFIVGKMLIIHGGIDSKGKYLNDLQIFDFSSYIYLYYLIFLSYI